MQAGLVIFAMAGWMSAAVTVKTVSTRPDSVTGGDVLVEISGVPRGATIRVGLNGADISRAFRKSGTEMLGLVEGLRSGENTLEVDAGGERAQLQLKNHDVKGPVFSGPQEQPFVCQTQEFKLPDGTLLGPPLDEACSIATVVTYVYRSGDGGGFRPLRESGVLPRDVEWVTISTGERVPFVVRVETGTRNRAIYQFAVLHNPASEVAPNPLAPPKGWNRRLLYTFGGGCNGGWNKQGVSIGNGGVLHDDILKQGYAEASATLNVFGNNCNSVIAAETMMMVKERVIEAIGKPLFTFGRGGSGGAEQQIPIADNYPGLLDGIIPGATFPDVLSNAQMINDTQLVHRFFSRHVEEFTDPQLLAILGTARLGNYAAKDNRIAAAGTCPAGIPVAKRYDAKANAGGVRCDIFQHTAAVFGKDGAGFARRPMDNTGVQYGLQALNDGILAVDQFLDLNEEIGGFDRDGNFQAARSVADPEALRAAYRSGQMTWGGLGLAEVPVIDIRGYTDTRPNGDVHMKFHSFSLRERMRERNGGVENQVLLVAGSKAAGEMSRFSIQKMDEWLTRLAADTSNDPMRIKVVRAKPADLLDGCWARDGSRVAETQTLDGGECNKLYPTFRSVRMMAGGPARNDVLKCELKPVDWNDYKVGFTAAQKQRLLTIFAGGVCDWTKPGVEQRAPAGTWIRY